MLPAMFTPESHRFATAFESAHAPAAACALVLDGLFSLLYLDLCPDVISANSVQMTAGESSV